MKRLNEYTEEQLRMLMTALLIAEISAGKTVEQDFGRKMTFWKGEVEHALNDAKFTEKQLPFK